MYIWLYIYIHSMYIHTCTHGRNNKPNHCQIGVPIKILNTNNAKQ